MNEILIWVCSRSWNNLDFNSYFQNVRWWKKKIGDPTRVGLWSFWSATQNSGKFRAHFWSWTHQDWPERWTLTGNFRFLSSFRFRCFWSAIQLSSMQHFLGLFLTISPKVNTTVGISKYHISWHSTFWQKPAVSSASSNSESCETRILSPSSVQSCLAQCWTST